MATFRGGLRAGGFNATWPFATLETAAGAVVLSVSPKVPFALCRYEFSAADVTMIRPYGRIPLLVWGIRFEHTRSDYPKRVIFWCLMDRASLLAELARCGFRCSI
jgi:hypothetical protein